MMSRNLLYMPGLFANRILTWSRYDKASSTWAQKAEKTISTAYTAMHYIPTQIILGKQKQLLN